MKNSLRTDLTTWLRLVAEIVCDFLLIVIWGFTVVAIHKFVKNTWVLEGWSSIVAFAMEVLFDSSLLYRLLRLRFDFPERSNRGAWWR